MEAGRFEVAESRCQDKRGALERVLLSLAPHSVYEMIIVSILEKQGRKSNIPIIPLLALWQYLRYHEELDFQGCLAIWGLCAQMRERGVKSRNKQTQQKSYNFKNYGI